MASQAQSLGAQGRADQYLAGGRRIAFVEDQVDHLQHRCQARLALLAPGHIEGQAGIAERPLGPDDALGDGRLGGKKGAGNLVGRQPADETQGQGRASLARKDRMAGREDQAKKLIVDVVVHGRFEFLEAGVAFILQIPADLLMLAGAHPLATEAVDGAALGRGHKPGAGPVRNPAFRPFGQCGDERVLRQLFGQADVTNHPGQARDQPGPLDPEDRLDRLMDFGRRHNSPLRDGRSARQAAAATNSGSSSLRGRWRRGRSRGRRSSPV